MKSMLLVLLALTQVSGCVIAQNNKDIDKSKTIVLDFRKSLLYEKGYNEVLIEVPKGLKKKRVDDYHGYREYRFKHRNGSVFYITTDVYSGSYLNGENRMAIGIDTYSKSRSIELVDTIKHEGKQANGRYWLEYILGDVVIGYYNVPSEKKSEYDKALATLRRKK